MCLLSLPFLKAFAVFQHCEHMRILTIIRLELLSSVHKVDEKKRNEPCSALSFRIHNDNENTQKLSSIDFVTIARSDGASACKEKRAPKTKKIVLRDLNRTLATHFGCITMTMMGRRESCQRLLTGLSLHSRRVIGNVQLPLLTVAEVPREGVVTRICRPSSTFLALATTTGSPTTCCTNSRTDLIPHQASSKRRCYSRTTSTSCSNSNNSSSNRPDPFARRPNQKCDPYGQGGKPLEEKDAERLLATVEDGWKIETSHHGEGKSNNTKKLSLVREFYHNDFISGSMFVKEIAAVAQMNDHYPSIRLERKLNSKRKQWEVTTKVQCHTFVLGGLSHHDFYLATVRFFLANFGSNVFFVCLYTCVVEYLRVLIFLSNISMFEAPINADTSFCITN